MGVHLEEDAGKVSKLGAALAGVATGGVIALSWLGVHHGVETIPSSDPMLITDPGRATIGANVVPPLTCEEDEVIGFYQVGPTPYHLACLPRESVVLK